MSTGTDIMGNCLTCGQPAKSSAGCQCHHMRTFATQDAAGYAAPATQGEQSPTPRELAQVEQERDALQRALVDEREDLRNEYEAKLQLAGSEIAELRLDRERLFYVFHHDGPRAGAGATFDQWRAAIDSARNQ